MTKKQLVIALYEFYEKALHIHTVMAEAYDKALSLGTMTKEEHAKKIAYDNGALHTALEAPRAFGFTISEVSDLYDEYEAQKTVA